MKIFKNNMYMLKLLFEACPSRVIFNIILFIMMRMGDIIYGIFLMRFIAQSIEVGAPFENIVIFLLIVLVYGIITSLFEAWFVGYYTPKTNVIIQKFFLEKVYAQATTCDLSCYENPKFYDKYTRANAEILERGIQLLETVSNMFSTIITGIICIVIIARWEPLILPIVIVCSVCAVFIDKKRADLKFTSYKKSTPYDRQMDYVKRTLFLQDFAKEMRLGRMFFPLMDNFERALKSSLSIKRHYYSRASLLRVVREIFMSLGIFMGAQSLIIFRYITYNAYKLSDVITVLNAASSLQWRIYSFSNHIAEFIDHGLYVESIREFLEYKPVITENENGSVPKEGSNHLELRNVSFTYEGQEKPTLKNISIDIPPKTKIALVGHNGAGKSTLVKLIMRLYDVTGGEILLDGENIKSFKLSEYRHKFGTIFQDFKIFAATVTENVLLHPPKDTKDVQIAEDALKQSGLYERITKLDNGMDTQLTKEFDDNGALMSGGEFQKLAVARVFAKTSSIAILDEPSSALDPISEYEMFNNMMTACDDKTVIFISHRLSSAVMADKIYMLENGEIIEEGSHSELMEKGGKYAEMFLMQSEKYREGGDTI